MVLAFLESDSITDALQSRTGAFDVDALQALVCSMASTLALVESIHTILRPYWRCLTLLALLWINDFS